MERKKKKTMETLKMKLIIETAQTQTAITFMNDTDEEIDAEIEEEDWIADEAMERMNTPKIQCWIKTHRRMKWRLAMRIVSLL